MIQIRVENFEGPLDLLLKMIEKQEMDITKVSLATIADQYVEYIKKSKDKILPEEIGDFLVVAAKLLFIKSKTLLPYLQWGEEEEEVEELTQQLKIYKEFLEASKKIDEMVKEKRFTYSPSVTKGNKKRAGLADTRAFYPPKNLKTEDLKKTLKQVIKQVKKSEFLEEKLEEDKIDYKISIEDKIETVRDLVSRKVKFNFDKILTKSNNKTEIIVSFLAILELSKQKTLIINQGELFSSIEINPINEKKI